MQKSFLRQLHIWLKLVLVFGTLAGQSLAYASCNPDAMGSQTAESCCVKQQTVCSCPTNAMQHNTSSAANALSHPCVGSEKPSCPCLASTPYQETSSILEPQRVQIEFALWASVPSPSLISVAAQTVRACYVCAASCDDSAFPLPPRAPPFQG